MMAYRALVSEQQQQPRVGGAKPKKAQGLDRNRKALGDIGNLVPGPVANAAKKPQNQPNRPVTRSFGAQLLAKAQAQAAVSDKNNFKKPGAENANVLVRKEGVAAKAAASKREPLKPKVEPVVVKSSDEEENKKGRKVKDGSQKKPNKSLTSILSARSKAACGISKKPKDLVFNIDAEDANNELAAVEYVDDIYNFYKLTENDGRVHDYIDSQPEINSKMRAILVDWLIDIHRRFELVPESLYLTVNIVDRFLSVKTVPRRELQLVGISAMLLACKYEEIWAPEVSDFITISDNAYVREQVLQMEKAILGKLEWYLTVPTPYVFLVRYTKASIPADKEMENMSSFFAALGLMNYSAVIPYQPSELAAAAVYAARCTLNRSPSWTETLKHHTGYSEDEVRECAKLLVSFHAAAAENKLKAAYRMYSSLERCAVALLPAVTRLIQPHNSSS